MYDSIGKNPNNPWVFRKVCVFTKLTQFTYLPNNQKIRSVLHGFQNRFSLQNFTNLESFRLAKTQITHGFMMLRKKPMGFYTIRILFSFHTIYVNIKLLYSIIQRILEVIFIVHILKNIQKLYKSQKFSDFIPFKR